MRAGPARTSSTVWYALFSVTVSPAMGRARTESRYVPGASGGTRIRMRATSPASGNLISSVPTMRPFASTVTVVRSPPAPRTPIATSISSVAPDSTLDGADTRSIATSRAKRSWPTPTVYIGTRRARSASRAVPRSLPPLSAPSVTTTTPASGIPARSSRATSSAFARSVRAPLAVSVAAPDVGVASAAKRKVRSANRSDSRRTTALVSAKARCIAASRPSPLTSRIFMLRESSNRMASTFRCATALESTTVGRSRQARTISTDRARSTPSTIRSRRVTARKRL